MTLVLAICLWGILRRVGPVGFTVGFVFTWIIVLCLSWTGRYDRLLPAALATLLVSIWPVYRWLATGDSASTTAFLFVAGFIDGLLLLSIGMDFAVRRGWVSTSPGRRRTLFTALILNGVSSVIGWPTGTWHTGFSVALFVTILLCLFWPSRPRSLLPNQSVTA